MFRKSIIYEVFLIFLVNKTAFSINLDILLSTNSELRKCSKYFVSNEENRIILPIQNPSPGQFISSFQELNLTKKVTQFQDAPKFRQSCNILILTTTHPHENNNDFLFNFLKDFLNRFNLHPAKVYTIFNFIFTNLKDGHQFLLDPKIKHKIKYKLVQLTEPFDSKPHIFTVCYFCPINDQIIDLSNEIQEENWIGKIFPNFSKNFRGTLLRVSVPTEVTTLTEIRLDELTEKWKSYRGLFNLILDKVQIPLNFSAELFPSANNGE
jgi:hypothetical protein